MSIDRNFLYLLDESAFIVRRNGQWQPERYRKDAIQHRLTNEFGGTEAEILLPRIPFVDKSDLVLTTTDRVVTVGDARIFNLYRPSTLKPAAGNWDIIRAVFLNLVDGNVDHLEYVLDWLAAPLQALHRRGEAWLNRVALVFHGAEGTGKGTGMEVMKHIYGPEHFYVASQAFIDSQYHGDLEGKLFVNYDEVISGDNRTEEIANRLKPFITNEHIQVRNIYRGFKTIRNYANSVFTSNSDRPVLISKSDRRYSVFRSDRKIGTALVGQVMADLNGARTAVAAFLEHLLSRVITSDVTLPLDTDARRVVQDSSLPTDELFAREVRELGYDSIARLWAKAQRTGDPTRITHYQVGKEGNKEEVVLSGTLHEVYNFWCGTMGLKPKGRGWKQTFLSAWGAEEAHRTVKGLGLQRVWIGIPFHTQPTQASPASEEQTGAAEPVDSQGDLDADFTSAAKGLQASA
ncbi:MAG: primase-helicase family protein [Myxococcaceae bacterium]